MEENSYALPAKERGGIERGSRGDGLSFLLYVETIAERKIFVWSQRISFWLW
jgi:hypothetical protein